MKVHVHDNQNTITGLEYTNFNIFDQNMRFKNGKIKVIKFRRGLKS